MPCLVLVVGAQLATSRISADAPEPKARAYLSSGPAGPTLERKQEHPHLKAWATDPTLPEQSLKAQDT